MSGEGFDIGGKEKNVVGLYGISKNECRVIIDPKNEKYAFHGNIFCESGQVNGLLVGSYLKGLTQVTNEDEWKKVFTAKDKDNEGNRWKPDFYNINPILLISYIPNSTPTIYLPPNGNKPSDYAESLAFLGYKFYLINRLGKGLTTNQIQVRGIGANIKVYGNDILQQTYKLGGGRAVVLTGSIGSDGGFFWLVEEGSTSSDLGSGSIEKPSFNIKDNTNIGQMTWTKVPLTTGPSDNGTIKP